MIFQFSDKNHSMPVAYSSIDAMHTKMELIIAGIGKDDAKKIASLVWDVAKKDEIVMNRFNPESELHRVNTEAFANDVAIGEELFMVLEMCHVFKSATKGYFDITANTSERNCHNTEYKLDVKRHSVRFMTDGTRLDLGGFAKGYALDKMVKILRGEQVQYALINLGDSSSYAIGTHPFGQWWPVSMEHPYFKGRTMHSFKLTDCALSVSGKNRNGKAHIVDPTTGNLVQRDELIAVRGASPLVTEILSTAIYVAPESIRGEIAVEFPEYIIEKITPLCSGDSSITKIQRLE